MKGTKSVWDDISSTWKRIAAVITAVGVLSAFLINTFDFHSGKTILIAGTAGLVVLIVSFYVDRQTKYIEDNFNTALSNHESEAATITKTISSNVETIRNITLDTRKDTLRIQLMMMIQNQPTNKDSILKLAETYFVKMHGDWYMTSEFRAWAKSQKVDIPDSIFNKLDSMEVKHED